ncbi:MAG: hypothetical protein LBP76_08520, partial [Treponema sp.]|nr:hypothetical protein [Treponema sp.]
SPGGITTRRSGNFKGASGASAGPGYPLQYLRYFRFYPLRREGAASAPAGNETPKPQPQERRRAPLFST